jgi:hypothetical protein
LVDADRHACALADGADMHVSEEDVPNLMVVMVLGAAAGKGWHPS